MQLQSFEMSDVISPAVVKSLPTLTCSLDFCTRCEDSPPINFETWRAEDKHPMTVYGRNGSRQVFHRLKRCTRRECRTAYFHSYCVLKGREKEFYKDCLFKEVLGI